MKEFRFGDMVWTEEGVFQYLGYDEEGALQLVRPAKESAFNIIEFYTIYPDEDDVYDTFYALNGETVTEKCKRKNIPVPDTNTKNTRGRERVKEALDLLKKAIKENSNV